jgi:hypothetical protein
VSQIVNGDNMTIAANLPDQGEQGGAHVLNSMGSEILSRRRRTAPSLPRNVIANLFHGPFKGSVEVIQARAALFFRRNFFLFPAFFLVLEQREPRPVGQTFYLPTPVGRRAKVRKRPRRLMKRPSSKTTLSRGASSVLPLLVTKSSRPNTRTAKSY